MNNQIEENKKIAGENAVQYIKDGMTIGLGSGSTIYWTLKKLGELVGQGLNVKGIPSSIRTENLAKEFGIPLTSFSEVQQLDLAIDGADEVDQNFNLIKGGGGSLVREKIVCAASKQLVIVVDESKVVQKIGTYPLPIEVVPFGWEVTSERISSLGCIPKLRMHHNEVFISNNGNYILDCKFDFISKPLSLHQELKQLLGVVETGLFIGMTDKVIIGKENGLFQILDKNK